MLSNSAFNALLKTIEEPPPNVVFIFATTELQKVPATIKSRCQQFNFRLLPIDIIKALLEEACAETGISADDEALFWIARESTGSARDAYTLFDQVVSFSEGHINSALIREKLGLVGLDKLNEFAEACAANDLPEVFSQIDAILDAGVAVEQFILDLAAYYHSLLLIKAGVTRSSILGYPLERYSAKVLEKLNAEKLAHAGELLFDLYRDIRYSVSSRFEIKNISTKLCWLDRWVSPADLAEALRQAQALLKHGNPAFGRNPNSEVQNPLAPGARESSGEPLAVNPFPDSSVKKNDKEPRPVNTSSAGASGLDLYSQYSQWQADKKKPEEDLSGPRFQEENLSGPTQGFPEGDYDAGKNRQELSLEQRELDPAVQSVLKIFNGTIINKE